MQNQIPIIIMNFSGIYEEENFWRISEKSAADEYIIKENTVTAEKQISWMELRDISGTNCYCDEEAIAEIGRRMENLPAAGIHFIDSGNYHYMTRLWLAKMEVPFALLVFDNHTDMQPPAFGGLLSCGGWIAAALEELENLCHVILIGPDEAAYEQVEEELKEKVTFLSEEMLQRMNDDEISVFLEETLGRVCGWNYMGNPEHQDRSEDQNGLNQQDRPELLDHMQQLPLYISIDKDVLCPEDAQTTWSQGDMRLSTLLSCVQTVKKCAKQYNAAIAGVDICGEADMEGIHDNRANDYANQMLLEIFCE